MEKTMYIIRKKIKCSYEGKKIRQQKINTTICVYALEHFIEHKPLFSEEL